MAIKEGYYIESVVFYSPGGTDEYVVGDHRSGGEIDRIDAECDEVDIKFKTHSLVFWKIPYVLTVKKIKS